MSTRVSWFHRNPKKTLLLVNLFILLVILLIAELGLSAWGYRAGYLTRQKYFQPVDSLVLIDDYIGDEHGIMHLDPSRREMIHGWINGKSDPSQLENSLFNSHTWSVKNLIRDYHALQNKKSLPEDSVATFYRIPHTLRRTADSSLTETGKLYKEYYSRPVNSDGFRSIEFKPVSSKNPKVLLLGDSFTWGLSARPVFHSFADLLSNAGYITYNSGIISTDPAQYALIAEEYVPELKPDFVVVNYFTGNDHMHHYRNETPGKKLYHPANSGWIWAYPLGYYMEAQDAYEYALNQTIIPHQDSSLFNRMCAKTILTTGFWMVMRNKLEDGQRGHDERFPPDLNIPYHEEPVSEHYIKRIKKVCDANGSKMVLSLIFPKRDMGRDYKELASEAFKETPYTWCGELKKEHYYDPPDGHFSNTGHLLYSKHLKAVLDSLLPRKMVSTGPDIEL